MFRAANVLFALAFVFAAVVQYNDPDPLQWVAIYLGAAACCVLFELGRLPRVSGLGLALLAFVWALTLLPEVLRHAPPLGEVVGDVKMYQPGVEEAREMLGLLLVAAWTLTLGLRQPRVTSPRADKHATQ